MVRIILINKDGIKSSENVVAVNRINFVHIKTLLEFNNMMDMIDTIELRKENNVEFVYVYMYSLDITKSNIIIKKIVLDGALYNNAHNKYSSFNWFTK